MSASTHLRQELLRQLETGQWRAGGGRLPTERELAERYGVSRTTVRKVLAELKAQGLIRQTVGSGTYLAGAAQGIQHPAHTVSPAELMEARLALEPAVMDLAVRNATSADFERMETCCRNAEAAQTLEEFEHWDGALHEAIAAAAHNSFISRVFGLIQQVREQGDWGLLKKRSVTPERRLLYQAEHRQLVEALRERDLERARAVTLEHLLHVRHNLLGH
ncbi:MAG: FCD domain-containing protein [Serpentinimonas sp.]|jgi:DNA-binding FadR family transcriptional regulator|nr:FCD domain-containing protein [Serpentinimonas sp.]